MFFIEDFLFIVRLNIKNKPDNGGLPSRVKVKMNFLAKPNKLF